MFQGEIAGNQTNVQLQNIFAIENNGLGALSTVTKRDFRGNGLAIGYDGVDNTTADVVNDGAEMIAEGVVGSFAWLGHEVGDVNARGFGASDSLSNLWDE